MPYTDTKTLDLSSPVPTELATPGWLAVELDAQSRPAKRLDTADTRWSDGSLEESAFQEVYHGLPGPERETVPFTELLAYVSLRVWRSVRHIPTAALLALASLTSREEWTHHFDVGSAAQIARLYKRAAVSVSPRLRMPRQEVGASSLLRPSGAYLTWLQIVREEKGDSE